jgi:hypothetical protein
LHREREISHRGEGTIALGEGGYFDHGRRSCDRPRVSASLVQRM